MNNDTVIDDLFESEDGLVLIEADKGLRFANCLIDSIVGNIIGYGAIYIFEFGTNISDYLYIELSASFLPSILSVIYYIFFEHYVNGQTIGKMVTGTKVLTKEGEQPSLGQIIGRSFARLIPFDAFSYLGASNRGWHDRLSSTLVIHIKNSKAASRREEDYDFGEL